MSKPPQTLLIDGDILLYRFACTNAFKVEWGDSGDMDTLEEPVTSEVINLETAQFDIAMFIQRLQEKLNAIDSVVIFSGKNNFRYGVLPTYKHNRVGLEKPLLYAQLKEYVVKNYTTKEKETLEGDDVMGILATRWPGHFIVCTIDKDLQQIPGKLYNWNTEKFSTISEEEADRYFYKQVLTGDSTDGYTGIPGIGPKKAEALLAAADEKGETYWQHIVWAYIIAGLTEEDALQQARVARILRASDYDFKKKEIIPWNP